MCLGEVVNIFIEYINFFDSLKAKYATLRSVKN